MNSESESERKRKRKSERGEGSRTWVTRTTTSSTVYCDTPAQSVKVVKCLSVSLSICPSVRIFSVLPLSLQK
jgi:hypothetical protein